MSPDTLAPVTLTERVRKKVRASAIDQQTIATALGVTRTAVSHMLTTRRGINADYLDPIAAALKITVGSLVSDDANEKPHHVLEPDEEELLRLYRAGDTDRKFVILQMARYTNEPVNRSRSSRRRVPQKLVKDTPEKPAARGR